MLVKYKYTYISYVNISYNLEIEIILIIDNLISSEDFWMIKWPERERSVFHQRSISNNENELYVPLGWKHDCYCAIVKPRDLSCWKISRSQQFNLFNEIILKSRQIISLKYANMLDLFVTVQRKCFPSRFQKQYQANTEKTTTNIYCQGLYWNSN